MRLSRSRIGVVVLFGAMTLTLTALAFPAVLGLDKADGNQNRVVASTSSVRSPRPTATSW